MIVLSLVERERCRTEFDREKKRIWSDEWTMVFPQPPLAFFMAYVPAEPSVVGMSMMTVALGWGTSAASYLYHTRATPDE